MEKEQVEIIEYERIYQPDFDKLNRQWIEKYFRLESIDAWVLEHPEEAILEPGGSILLARFRNKIVGAVALIKKDKNTFEFTKMAVATEIRNQGIGEKLSRAAIEKARQLGVNNLILYSNTVLENAIRLYYRVGFKEVELEAGGYQRCNIKMQYQWPEIEIRKGLPADAEMISFIGRISFAKTFSSVFRNKEEMAIYIDTTYGLEKIRSGLGKAGNHFFIAFWNGKPAGFAKLKEHSIRPELKYSNQTELQKIYLLPEFQGKGLAPKLLAEVKRLAIDWRSDCIWLDVIVENSRAIRFYEKNGFEKKGKHQFQIGTQLFNYHVMVNLPASPR